MTQCSKYAHHTMSGPDYQAALSLLRDLDDEYRTHPRGHNRNRLGERIMGAETMIIALFGPCALIHIQQTLSAGRDAAQTSPPVLA